MESCFFFVVPLCIYLVIEFQFAWLQLIPTWNQWLEALRTGLLGGAVRNFQSHLLQTTELWTTKSPHLRLPTEMHDNRRRRWWRPHISTDDLLNFDLYSLVSRLCRNTPWVLTPGPDLVALGPFRVVVEPPARPSGPLSPKFFTGLGRPWVRLLLLCVILSSGRYYWYHVMSFLVLIMCNTCSFVDFYTFAFRVISSSISGNFDSIHSNSTTVFGVVFGEVATALDTQDTHTKSKCIWLKCVISPHSFARCCKQFMQSCLFSSQNTRLKLHCKNCRNWLSFWIKTFEPSKFIGL